MGINSFALPSRVVALTALLCELSPGLIARTVVGTSNLLDAPGVAQIEAWLNEGPIQLALIFDKTAGDGKTVNHFHQAVDDTGRTIVLYRVAPMGTPGTFSVIGGFNPLGWSNCEQSQTYDVSALARSSVEASTSAHLAL